MRLYERQVRNMFFIVLIKTIDEENGAILSGKNALLFLYTKSSVVLYKLFFKKLIDIDLNKQGRSD